MRAQSEGCPQSTDLDCSRQYTQHLVYRQYAGYCLCGGAGGNHEDDVLVQDEEARDHQHTPEAHHLVQIIRGKIESNVLNNMQQV